MVRRPVDVDRNTFFIAKDATHVCEQAWFEFGIKEWPPVFRAEHDVLQKIGVSVRHTL